MALSQSKQMEMMMSIFKKLQAKPGEPKPGEKRFVIKEDLLTPQELEFCKATYGKHGDWKQRMEGLLMGL